MHTFVMRSTIIHEFAKQIAHQQKRADYWFYVQGDPEMSSYMLDGVHPLVHMCNRLGITDKVYEEAYKIYDFRDSGKDDYVPNLEELLNHG